MRGDSRGGLRDGGVAVLAHGAGSRPAFLTAALARPLAAVGVRLVAVRLRGHGGAGAGALEGDLTAVLASDLAAAAVREGATLVGGVSLGAHAAARVAVDDLLPGLSGLLLALPAWSGPADVVAAATAAQAEEVERLGLAAVLHRVGAEAPAWVAAELRASWPAHDPGQLVALLRTAGASTAPTLDQLAAVTVPAAVAVAVDDPLHPASVGRAWAAALPSGAVREVPLRQVGEDREALGRALASAWTQALSASR